MLYTLPRLRSELTTTVVIGTDDHDHEGSDMDINEYERLSNIKHIKVQKERFDCWFYISQSQ